MYKKLFFDYLDSKIEQAYLIENVTAYFHKLLSEKKFCETRYIKEYPVLSELMNDDIYTSEYELKQIQRLIEGKACSYYHTFIMLEERDVSGLVKVWEHFEKNHVLSDGDMDDLEKYMNKLGQVYPLISDYYIRELAVLLKDLPGNHRDGFFDCNSIYISGNIPVDFAVPVINRYFDILNGVIPADVSIYYRNTEVNIMVR